MARMSHWEALLRNPLRRPPQLEAGRERPQVLLLGPLRGSGEDRPLERLRGDDPRERDERPKRDDVGGQRLARRVLGRRHEGEPVHQVSPFGNRRHPGGLDEEQALRLITLNPAIQLGVERIVGSLEVGKHGDLAVFNEHPLSAYARCDLTVIEGRVFFDREAYLLEREAAATKPPADKPRGGAS